MQDTELQADVCSVITEERVNDIKERDHLSFLTNNTNSSLWNKPPAKILTNRFIQELKDGALTVSEEEIAATTAKMGPIETVLSQIRNGDCTKEEKQESKVELVDPEPQEMMQTPDNEIKLTPAIIGILKDIDVSVAELIGKRRGIIAALTDGNADWEISPCRTKLIKK